MAPWLCCFIPPGYEVDPVPWLMIFPHVCLLKTPKSNKSPSKSRIPNLWNATGWRKKRRKPSKSIQIPNKYQHQTNPQSLAVNPSLPIRKTSKIYILYPKTLDNTKVAHLCFPHAKQVATTSLVPSAASQARASRISQCCGAQTERQRPASRTVASLKQTRAVSLSTCATLPPGPFFNGDETGEMRWQD